MSGGCFAERHNDFIALSPNERDALSALEERERAFRRGAAIMRENDPCDELFIVNRTRLAGLAETDTVARDKLRDQLPEFVLVVALGGVPHPEVDLPRALAFELDGRAALLAIAAVDDVDADALAERVRASVRDA